MPKRRVLINSMIPFVLAALLWGKAQAQELPAQPPPAATETAPQSGSALGLTTAPPTTPNQAPGRGGAIALITAGSVLTAAGLVGGTFGVSLDFFRCYDGCQWPRISDSIGLETGSFLAFGLGGAALGYGATVLRERNLAPESPESQRRRVRYSLALGGGLLAGGVAMLIAAQAVSGAALAAFPDRDGLNGKNYNSKDLVESSGTVSVLLMPPAYALSFTGALFLGEAAARARMPVLIQPVVSTGMTGMTGLMASGSF